MISTFDTDRNGRLDFREFKAFVEHIENEVTNLAT